MEDILALSQPTPKDALRLILAYTIYHTKPPHLTLTGPLTLTNPPDDAAEIPDYLVGLRVGVYQRRLALARPSTGNGKEGEGLGGYGQINPFDDMMRTVVRLTRERAVQIERETGMEGERGIYAYGYEYGDAAYHQTEEVGVQGQAYDSQGVEEFEEDYEDDGL